MNAAPASATVSIARHVRFTIATGPPSEFIDLTDRICAIVAVSGLRSGIVNVQSLHATTAVIVDEQEPRSRAPFLTSSACLNVVRGAVLLGEWQRVFLVDLDGPADRQVSMMMQGEGWR